jgi:hypothetical protein
MAFLSAPNGNVIINQGIDHHSIVHYQAKGAQLGAFSSKETADTNMSAATRSFVERTIEREGLWDWAVGAAYDRRFSGVDAAVPRARQSPMGNLHSTSRALHSWRLRDPEPDSAEADGQKAGSIAAG